MKIRSKYDTELVGISNKLVLMCRSVENAITKSVEAFTKRDLDLVKEVYAEEKRADKLELKIEKACLKLLVMQQPVARDFRVIYTTLKMITDLERIGDQAKDIAKITKKFDSGEYTSKLDNIELMASIVSQMVNDGIEAYINRDLKLAQTLEEKDKDADKLFKQIMNDYVNDIKENPSNAEQGVLLIMVAKYLERIGDHAVNIGEKVEYVITGKYPKKNKSGKSAKHEETNIGN